MTSPDLIKKPTPLAGAMQAIELELGDLFQETLNCWVDNEGSPTTVELRQDLLKIKKDLFELEGKVPGGLSVGTEIPVAYRQKFFGPLPPEIQTNEELQVSSSSYKRLCTIEEKISQLLKEKELFDFQQEAQASQRHARRNSNALLIVATSFTVPSMILSTANLLYGGDKELLAALATTAATIGLSVATILIVRQRSGQNTIPLPYDYSEPSAIEGSQQVKYTFRKRKPWTKRSEPVMPFQRMARGYDQLRGRGPQP